MGIVGPSSAMRTAVTLCVVLATASFGLCAGLRFNDDALEMQVEQALSEGSKNIQRTSQEEHHINAVESRIQNEIDESKARAVKDAARDLSHPDLEANESAADAAPAETIPSEQAAPEPSDEPHVVPGWGGPVGVNDNGEPGPENSYGGWPQQFSRGKDNHVRGSAFKQAEARRVHAKEQPEQNEVTPSQPAAMAVIATATTTPDSTDPVATSAKAGDEEALQKNEVIHPKIEGVEAKEEVKDEKEVQELEKPDSVTTAPSRTAKPEGPVMTEGGQNGEGTGTATSGTATSGTATSGTATVTSGTATTSPEIELELPKKELEAAPDVPIHVPDNSTDDSLKGEEEDPHEGFAQVDMDYDQFGEDLFITFMDKESAESRNVKKFAVNYDAPLYTTSELKGDHAIDCEITEFSGSLSVDGGGEAWSEVHADKKLSSCIPDEIPEATSRALRLVMTGRIPLNGYIEVDLQVEKLSAKTPFFKTGKTQFIYNAFNWTEEVDKSVSHVEAHGGQLNHEVFRWGIAHSHEHNFGVAVLFEYRTMDEEYVQDQENLADAEVGDLLSTTTAVLKAGVYINEVRVFFDNPRLLQRQRALSNLRVKQAEARRRLQEYRDKFLYDSKIEALTAIAEAKRKLWETYRDKIQEIKKHIGPHVPEGFTSIMIDPPPRGAPRGSSAAPPESPIVNPIDGIANPIDRDTMSRLEKQANEAEERLQQAQRLGMRGHNRMSPIADDEHSRPSPQWTPKGPTLMDRMKNIMEGVHGIEPPAPTEQE